MGIWAKGLFGKEKFSEIGIVMAGTNTSIEKQILSFFDEVIYSKDSVYHGHLVRKGRKEYPLVTNVYGSPAMVDSITEMYDGGCRNIIFIGYAYGGFTNLDVGSIIIPNKSYHFDGIYHPIEPDRKISLPDNKLKTKLENIFKRKKINYSNGNNISVPAVTFQLPHYNKDYLEIKPVSVEMELAACFSRCKDIGIRTAGVLVISDNRKSSIHDEEKKKLKYESKMKVLEIIVNNLEQLNLKSLKTKKEFNVFEHLASIIQDPKDITNVYKK